MRNYTILSARYSNPDRSAVEAMTVEAGAVALSSADTPEAWAAMLEAVTPEPYQAPAAPVPQEISRRQFAQILAIKGHISEAEALALISVGAIPAALEPALAAMAPADQFAAKMLLVGATTLVRSHPMVATIGQGLGWTSEQIDDIWRSGAAL